MLKVCIVGLGNCGNQIAELAKVTKNIDGVAINSSQNDLVNVKSIPTVLVGDEKGAGKERIAAKKFVKSAINKILDNNNFDDLVSHQDVIFVVSSIGGGTGSGMTPMVTDILSRKYSAKTFVVVEVYPPIKESIGAQQNSMEYLNEIKNFLPNVTYMCYDNNKYANLTTSEMMKRVNSEIVEAIDILRGQYLYPTPFNSIDEKDMLKILSTPGRLAVYNVDGFNEKSLDEKTICERMVEVIRHESSNVELEKDGFVKRFGAITNISPKINDKYYPGTNDALCAAIGEPVESFEHNYINQDADDSNKYAVIFSGLSIPDDRLSKIVQRIEDGKRDLGNTKESTVLDTFNGDDVDDLRRDDKSVGELNLDEVFDKYF